MEVLTTVDERRVRELVAADEFFWLDLRAPAQDQLSAVGRLFDLHPAAMEDSEEWDQLPKVDDYHDHLLLVSFTAQRGRDGRNRPVEVHVYLSGGWIVTIRRDATPLDRIHAQIREGDGTDEHLIVYQLLDALADGWDPVVDELDARVDDVEVEVLERPRQQHLTTIYRLKQEVGDLLRIAIRQDVVLREAIELIDALPGLQRSSRGWLRDLVAHSDSIAGDLRRITGDLGALTDTFFNANANRLNRLATYVAVGSLYFLVLTLVTGYFGQNFGFLTRHVDSAAAFWIGGVALPLAVVVSLTALLFWRRRDWL
jgi:magnesium transporter